MSALHINHKETLTVVMAAEGWAPGLTGWHIIIHCDSQGTVAIINKGSTRNSLVMGFLPLLCWLSAVFNLRITAHYIEDVESIAIAHTVLRKYIKI